MTIAARVLATWMLTLLAWTAQAQTELHVIGIYEGRERTGTLVHGPQATVIVDRPGSAVTLLLLSYSPVRWTVEASETTEIREVFVSDHRRLGSEVLLNGNEFAVSIVESRLPHPYQATGANIEHLRARVEQELGFSTIESFQGAYTPEAAFWITGIGQAETDAGPGQPQATAEAEQVGQATDLSERMREAISAWLAEPAHRFTNDGFEIVDEQGRVILHPATLDVPVISWPVASAHDAERNVYYGISLGGEGFLYRYDRGQARWSVIRSMENFDARGMIYDPQSELLVAMGQGRILLMDRVDGTAQVHELRADALPQLQDLVQEDRRGRIATSPLALEGDLLLFAAHERQHGRIDQAELAALPVQFYVFDLTTGTARLVRSRE